MINFRPRGALLLTFAVINGEKQAKHRAAGKSESGSFLKTDATLWIYDSCSLLDGFQATSLCHKIHEEKILCRIIHFLNTQNRPITFFFYCKLHQVATAWGFLLAWRDNTCRCLWRAAVPCGVEQNSRQSSEKKKTFFPAARLCFLR